MPIRLSWEHFWAGRATRSRTVIILRYVIRTLPCLALIVVAACRGVSSAGPTAQPTATYTPRSTPLPALTATPAPGSAESPLRLVIAGEEAAGDPLVRALAASAGLNVVVEYVATQADAVREVCAAADGQQTAALVDGLGFAASMDCALPLLQVERDDALVIPVQLIANDGAGITVTSQMAFNVFCRLGVTDTVSWVLPQLMLRAAGLDADDLRSIVDVTDVESLIAAVNDGECEAAAVTSDDLSAAAAAERRNVDAVGDPLDFPAGLIVVERSMPLGIREALAQALRDVTAGDTGADVLDALHADGLVSVDEEGLARWNAFLQEAGLLAVEPDGA
jgi:ABC-type phosphate/phosphonate transport system substrate-binding protein